MEKPNVAVFIPTYNAGSKWQSVLQSIEMQTIKPALVAIIDSGSSDDTIKLAMQHHVAVNTISKAEFTHGFSRDKLVHVYPGYDIYVFLTQDAVLATPQSLRNILAAFNNDKTGVAFGRQLPNTNAGLIEQHNRLFNYPAQSYVRSQKDIATFGFKTIFCSNSFAAYRATAYHNAGGFPPDAFFGEDTLITAKMILKGWNVAYVANAAVVHSHNYSLKQEYERYVDIGRFHQANQWLYKEFGKPSREGVKYLLSELGYALKRNPFYVFPIFVRVFNKWLGFKAGFKKSG